MKMKMKMKNSSQLNRAIKNIIAVGGLTLVSTSSWAEAYQSNPNKIWLDSGRTKGVCAKDFDQDGDLDVFTVHAAVVNLIENIGSPTSPNFSAPKALSGHPNDLAYCIDLTRAFVDIDADGDLDSFDWTPIGKFSPGSFTHKVNTGSIDQPIYTVSFTTYDLPASQLMFKDIDSDGDPDVWAYNSHSAYFYKNTGTPEKAVFVKQDKSPVDLLCKDNRLGLIVDLNNDGEWDMLCRNKGVIGYVESSPTGYLPEKTIADLSSHRLVGNVRTTILDADHDGDSDIILSSSDAFYGGLVIYSNLGSELTPQFSSGKFYSLSKKPFTFLFDLNEGDGAGYLFLNDSNLIGYAVNSLDSTPYHFVANNTPTEFTHCNSSLSGFKNKNSDVKITDIDLVDIDGDSDLDLFTVLSNSKDPTNGTTLAYCENQGTIINASFAQAIISPFGLTPEILAASNHPRLKDALPLLSFYDTDADGDLDVNIFNNEYENTGSMAQASFRLSQVGKQAILPTIDTDNNGHVDSELTISRTLGVSFTRRTSPYSVTLLKHVAPTLTPKQQAVSVFNDDAGVLIIKEIKVSGLTYYAELKDQGGFQFVLTNATKLSEPKYATPANYNPETLFVNIPSVFAFGQLYTVQLKNNGHGIFSLVKAD